MNQLLKALQKPKNDGSYTKVDQYFGEKMNNNDTEKELEILDDKDRNKLESFSLRKNSFYDKIEPRGIIKID